MPPPGRNDYLKLWGSKVNLGPARIRSCATVLPALPVPDELLFPSVTGKANGTLWPQHQIINVKDGIEAASIPDPRGGWPL
jgi:hypothetical protein